MVLRLRLNVSQNSLELTELTEDVAWPRCQKSAVRRDIFIVV
jgi:hypothetical protein